MMSYYVKKPKHCEDMEAIKQILEYLILFCSEGMQFHEKFINQ